MGFPIENIAIVVAVAIPCLSFAASWGAMRLATNQFKASIKELHSEVFKLKNNDINKIEEKINKMNLDQTKLMRSYVMVEDCVKIRQDCARLHLSESQTLCVKLDNLSQKVSKISEALESVDNKRQEASERFSEIAHKLDLSVSELKVTLNNLNKSGEHNELRI